MKGGVWGREELALSREMEERERGGEVEGRMREREREDDDVVEGDEKMIGFLEGKTGRKRECSCVTVYV